MEVKKIVEGMTAPQVAQVIDENFKAQNKILEDDIKKQNNAIGVSEYKAFSEAESVAVGAVRLYNGVMYECVEATTGAFDASKWKVTSFKKETEEKLSELGQKVNYWNPTRSASPVGKTYNIDTALEALANFKESSGTDVSAGYRLGFVNSEYKYEEWIANNSNQFDKTYWARLANLSDEKLNVLMSSKANLWNPTRSASPVGKTYNIDTALEAAQSESIIFYAGYRLGFINDSFYIYEEWLCTQNNSYNKSDWEKVCVRYEDVEKINSTIKISNDFGFNSIVKELYISDEEEVKIELIDKIYLYNGYNGNYGFQIVYNSKTYQYLSKDVSVKDNCLFNVKGLYAVIDWYSFGKERYETGEGFKLTDILIGDLRNMPILYNYISNAESINIVIPDKIYAVVDDRLQLFYKSIFNCLNLDNYIIRIECSKGKAYPRYFQYIPTSEDVGEVDITFSIYRPSSLRDYTGTLIMSKKSKLITKGKDKESPLSKKRILIIGDSTITAGVYQNEAFRRLTKNDGEPKGMSLNNIEFVGRRVSNECGVTTKYEGTSGWSWNNYISPSAKSILFNVSGVTNVNIDDVYRVYSGDIVLKMLVSEINITEGQGYIRCLYDYGSESYSATPDNSGIMVKLSGDGDNNITYTSIEEDNFSPFYNNETSLLDVKGYVDKYCDGNIDYFIAVLGINSIGQMYSYNKSVASIMNEVKTLINAVHSDFPNAKICVATIPMPSQNGGFGATYNASYRAVKQDYERRAFDINNEYINMANSEEYSDYVYIINLCSEFDADYLYPVWKKTVNSRSSETELVGANSVHPDNNGYLSEGDTLFRFIYSTL